MTTPTPPPSREDRRKARREARANEIIVIEDDIVIDVEDFFASPVADALKKRVGEQIRNLMGNVTEFAQNGDAASLGGNVLALGSGSDTANGNVQPQLTALGNMFGGNLEQGLNAVLLMLGGAQGTNENELMLRLSQAARVMSGDLKIDSTGPAPRLKVEKDLADAGTASGSLSDETDDFDSLPNGDKDKVRKGIKRVIAGTTIVDNDGKPVLTPAALSPADVEATPHGQVLVGMLADIKNNVEFDAGLPGFKHDVLDSDALKDATRQYLKS